MTVKQSDISEEQFKRAASFAVTASHQLRDEAAEGEERWYDDDYRNAIDDMLFFGRYWRRVARINSVEDAKRELQYVAARLEQRLTEREGRA